MRRLCTKLKDFEPDALERGFGRFHPKHQKPRERGLYCIGDTFCQTVIVIDRRSSRKNGVLLVCKNQATASTLGMEEGIITAKGGRVTIEGAELNVEGGTPNLEEVGEKRQWN